MRSPVKEMEVCRYTTLIRDNHNTSIQIKPDGSITIVADQIILKPLKISRAISDGVKKVIYDAKSVIGHSERIDYGTDYKLRKTRTHRSSYCLIFRRHGPQTGPGSKR